MIILLTIGKKPFRVEYKKGNKTYSKQLPTNTIVAMKGLEVVQQISNRNQLAQKGVTIYNYETGAFFNHGAGATRFNGTLPVQFIGHNVKSSEIRDINYGFSGTSTISGMTFVAQNITSRTLFSIITSATTMANNTRTVSASTNNVVVFFSGATTTTQDIYAALSGSSFSGLGITITGQGATKINTGSTVQSFLSAYTKDINSVFVYLDRLV
jgi:hypothetical protein